MKIIYLLLTLVFLGCSSNTRTSNKKQLNKKENSEVDELNKRIELKIESLCNTHRELQKKEKGESNLGITYHESCFKSDLIPIFERLKALGFSEEEICKIYNQKAEYFSQKYQISLPLM